MTAVLSALPSHERPRERLYALGVEALSERELLALVLRSGRPGESAVDLASSLLARFGGLAALQAAFPEEIAAVPGIGPAKAAAVLGALRLGSMSRQEEKRTMSMARPADLAHAAMAHLAGLRRERVLVLVCDGGNRLTQVVTVSNGSMDRSVVPIREVLNAVLRHDGRAFGVAHNHPSGDASPSDADLHVTDELVRAAKAVGLRFLGHVVVAEEKWCSANRTR